MQTIRSSTTQLQVITVILAAVPAMGTRAASAPSITPLTQDRSVNAFVIVPPCGSPQTVSEFSEAVDFAPFQEAVKAMKGCAVAQGLASATQDSAIGATQVIATGDSSSSASATPFTVIHAISSSDFEVTFALDAKVRYLAEGSVATNGTAQLVYAGALVQLRTGTNAIIAQASASTYGTGIPGSAVLHATGTLDAGTYMLRASASTIIDHTVPPSGAGASEYTLDLRVTHLADFDFDGVVNGSDLAQLLGAWGPCSGCTQDLDGNGAVDGADLAIVIASWR